MKFAVAYTIASIHQNETFVPIAKKNDMGLA